MEAGMDWNGMEVQYQEIKFPQWLPDGLKNDVLERRKLLKSRARWEVEDRFLSDPRMEKIWAKFNNTEQMVEFLMLLMMAYLEATEKLMTPDEYNKIRRIKKQVCNQLKSFTKTVKLIDEFCTGPATLQLVPRSVLDGDKSYENQLNLIKNKLILQLDFYKLSGTRFRLFLSPIEIDQLYSIKKRGQVNYIEIFVREFASIYFVRQFKQPHYSLAEDLSLVACGTPSNKNATPQQKIDRVRKRRENQRSRLKK